MNITRFLQQLGACSATDAVTEGVTRLPFSKEQKEAAHFLAEEMRKLDMDAVIDPCGTVSGIYPGAREETVMFSSHYDSVRCGGIYDGDAGIALGLAVVSYFKENGIVPPVTIAVTALNDEEGTCFQEAFLSSRSMLSHYGEKEYRALIARESGKSAWELMGENGDVVTLAGRLSAVTCNIEAHIEQGPVLDREGLEIGLVDGIVTIYHAMVRLNGISNHAGTTPMDLRVDPVPVLGEILTQIPNLTKEVPASVATVGQIFTRPGSNNVIPAAAEFSLDMRCLRSEDLERMKAQFFALLAVSHERHPEITAEILDDYVIPGAMMDEKLLPALEEAAKKIGAKYRHMNSGAGHDAMVFAKELPTAMVFVPSVGGLSHTKVEFTKEEDLQRAASLLVEFVKGRK